MPAGSEISFPAALVHLPIAFDDAESRAAVERYIDTIRGDAPNVEGGTNIDYVVRYNGLPDREALYETVLATEQWIGVHRLLPRPAVHVPARPARRACSCRSTTRRARGRPRARSGSAGRATRSTRSSRRAATSCSGARCRSTTSRGRNEIFRDDPLLLRPGDRVRFHRVEEDELLERLRGRAAPTATATDRRTAPSTSGSTLEWRRPSATRPTSGARAPRGGGRGGGP